MGGETGVESTLGQGSTFWFTAVFGQPQGAEHGLAVATVAGNGVVWEEVLKTHYRGTRVLVCEDNEINQEIIRELLQDLGFVVDLAENGAVGVALASRQPYDLVLMDMQMPVVDGLEATRTLRATPACSALPIIAMTANAFASDREACLQAGMNGFLSKPVNPKNLFELILKVLPPPA